MKSANNSLVSLGSATYAAKRAADVVFVLQNKDRLEYRRLLTRLKAVFKEYGEQATQVSELDLDALKAVSRMLYEVFAAADVPSTALAINALLTTYGRTPRLSSHGNTAWHIHVDEDDHAPWAEWFAASSAMALATLLAEKQRNPAGLCASPTCGRPFIDLGKGGGRSYCSPRCATRERVALHRRKQENRT